MPDVNILVAAFRRGHQHEQSAKEWLREAISSGDGLGLSSIVTSGFVRVVTNRTIYPADATPIDIALTQIETLRENPGVVDLVPGPRHWAIFAQLCRQVDARGNLVADAAHAAIAIEHGATWVSLDRDFARFPGLRWERPFD